MIGLGLNLAKQISGKIPPDTGDSIVLDNFVDNLDQDPPALSFDSTDAGTATWDFHSSATSPTPGTGDIDTGTFAVAAGANNTTIDLAGNEGQTGYIHITVSDGTLTSNALTSQVITVAAIAPSAFVDADWFVATGSGAGELDISITSLPDNGGANITDVEYELDASGIWTSSGGTVGFTITGLSNGTSYDVRLRAVNSAGNGAAGNTETAISGAPAATVPDAFVDADWSVATGGSGELDVSIASLPSDGGSAITDIEYELDASGTWTSSGGTVGFTISGLTESTSYDVRLRAVNSVGNSAAGNTETATSGSSETLILDLSDLSTTPWDLEVDVTTTPTSITAIAQSGVQTTYIRAVAEALPAAGTYYFVADVDSITTIENVMLSAKFFDTSVAPVEVNFDCVNGAVDYESDTGVGSISPKSGGGYTIEMTMVVGAADLQGHFDIAITEHTNSIVRITDPTGTESATITNARIVQR